MPSLDSRVWSLRCLSAGRLVPAQSSACAGALFFLGSTESAIIALNRGQHPAGIGDGSVQENAIDGH